MTDRRDELIEELSAKFGQEKAEELEGRLCDIVGGSPIERLMALAIYYAASSGQWFAGEGQDLLWNASGSPPISFKEIFQSTHVPHSISVWQQVSVDQYRADFIVRLSVWHGGSAWGAIECDGHDYHNLTRDQAVHDRARDRHFQSVGLTILRYPGSEIYARPLRCAVDALSILEKLASPNHPPEGEQK